MSGDAASVLVIPVPEIDGLLGQIRLANDPSARDGMPAHVTLLTPFVPALRWNAIQAARLAAAVSRIPCFEARFRRTGRFGTTTLYLVPEPEGTFARLSAAIAAAFPEFPPYGGAVPDVVPHLTLAHGVPEATLNALDSVVDRQVDVRVRVRDLFVFSKDATGRWSRGPHVALPEPARTAR